MGSDPVSTRPPCTWGLTPKEFQGPDPDSTGFPIMSAGDSDFAEPDSAGIGADQPDSAHIDSGDIDFADTGSENIGSEDIGFGDMV